MNSIDLERRVLKLERAIYNNYKFHKVNENVSLNTFGCDRLESMLEDNLANYSIEIDINDDNADYGFVSVGIYSDDEYLTSYDIIVSDVNSFDVECDDKKIGTSKSLEDAADMLADHFMKDYMNGKYNKEKK